MIYFNQAPYLPKEQIYINQALRTHHTGGGGVFHTKCTDKLSEILRNPYVLMTTSGTHALELAALLCDIRSGDEVIMPSYTFPSTASAFALRGATVVFVDIRPDTMNLNEKLIEDAVTERTKAIVPVHYAGVGCEMNDICAIAKRHGLYIIEDAAQALMALL
jgi:dTDP-4-amino-4,6-dideoxygalactose transaminase